ncbi:cell division protein PerM [Microbacterium sp. NPDC055903]
MQRLLVALLAALDAAVAAAVGLTVLLAPLTLLWTFAFGGSADWGVLWPVTAALWQFGHGAAIHVELGADILVATGTAQEAASFVLSVTPLAIGLFTLFFAARSGARAARAGAWTLGVLAGAAVFAGIAVLVALTSQSASAGVPLAAGIAWPVGIYAVGALAGAVQHAWREGDEGPIDRVHDIVDSWGPFAPVPGEAVRGAAIVLVLLTGVGALAVALMVVLRGGEVVALFERAHVDALGATIITLGQLAYLPTLIVWAVAWIAGPGFAIGTGTAVSPVGTELGVVPGIPVFGLLPDGGSIWMLIVVLIPIAAGAVAGWMIRSRLVWEGTADDWRARAAIAAGIPVLVATVAALAGSAVSGSIGPGRLSEVGPDPWLLALVLGGEVLLGTTILLLSPRNREEIAEERTDRWVALMGTSPSAADEPIPAPHLAADEQETAPIEESGFFGRPGRDSRGTAPR